MDYSIFDKSNFVRPVKDSENKWIKQWLPLLEPSWWTAFKLRAGDNFMDAEGIYKICIVTCFNVYIKLTYNTLHIQAKFVRTFFVSGIVYDRHNFHETAENNWIVKVSSKIDYTENCMIAWYVYPKIMQEKIQEKFMMTKIRYDLVQNIKLAAVFKATHTYPKQRLVLIFVWINSSPHTWAHAQLS